MQPMKRNNHRHNNNRSNNKNFYRSRSSGSGGGGQQSDQRTRAKAQQALEKYTNMAKDTASSGDIVMAEYYYQHADHYFRVVQACTPPEELQRQQRQQQENADAEDGVQYGDGSAPDASVTSSEREQDGSQQSDAQRNTSGGQYRQYRYPRHERSGNGERHDGRNRNNAERSEYQPVHAPSPQPPVSDKLDAAFLFGSLPIPAVTASEAKDTVISDAPKRRGRPRKDTTELPLS